VFGATMMASHAARIFKDQKYGDIVNIASTASLKGYKMGSIYAASKFALRGLSQCWQAELRPYNVRVIQINPSEVPTAFAKVDRVEKPLEDNKLTPKEIADTMVAALKMDRRGFIPEVSVFATNPF
jgi:3-oxoacyl-[acyl-carrier protein] reductase